MKQATIDRLDEMQATIADMQQINLGLQKKIDELILIFSQHLNLNTSSINLLTDKINALSNAPAVSQPTEVPAQRPGNTKEGSHGPHS